MEMTVNRVLSLRRIQGLKNRGLTVTEMTNPLSRTHYTYPQDWLAGLIQTNKNYHHKPKTVQHNVGETKLQKCTRSIFCFGDFCNFGFLSDVSEENPKSLNSPKQKKFRMSECVFHCYNIVILFSRHLYPLHGLAARNFDYEASGDKKRVEALTAENLEGGDKKDAKKKK